MLLCLAVVAVGCLAHCTNGLDQPRFSDKSDLKTLRFVHLLWRHGDRSPAIPTFPTDTDNPEETWPQGWGELSEIGMRQHYALGQYLRNRYDGFLSKRYSKYEIYVRSTSLNRTIMSAMADMAGLYPPDGDQVWHQNLTWQPVPVHSRPREMDPMLITSYPCNRVDDIWVRTVSKNAVFKSLMDKYAPTIVQLRNKTGLELENGFFDAWTIYDPVNCERRHNDTHKVPDWLNDELFTEIKAMYDQSSRYYFYEREILRIKSGLLNKDILTRMQRKADNESDSRSKVHVYSAHDTTLMSFLQSLGAYNGFMPPYASCLAIELHYRNGRYEVDFWYRNSTETPPFALEIAGCKHPCTLEAFARRSKAYIPDDFESECNYKPWWPPGDSKLYSIIVSGVCVVLLVMLLALTATTVCLWRENRRQMTRLRAHNDESADHHIFGEGDETNLVT